MIYVYQKPFGVEAFLVSNVNGVSRDGRKVYAPTEMLFGKQSSQLAEGVYDEEGNYQGSFVDFWHSQNGGDAVWKRHGA
jgi:hypothetical protein